MIPLQNLVVENGKIKRVYTITQEQVIPKDGGMFGSSQISCDGIHSGIRLVTEDLPDEEIEELAKALKELQLDAETVRRAESIKRRREGHGVTF